MSRARSPLLIFVIAATLAAGCGSSEDSGSESSGGASGGTPTATATSPAAPPGAAARGCEDTIAGAERLRVTGVGCDVGQRIVAAWVGKPACSSPADASRFSCSVEDYRCLGASVEGGIAISCSRPGGSIAFVAKRG